MSETARGDTKAPDTVKRRRGPYVGPRAIRDGEPFFGRELEAAALVNKLLPGGIILLHSPSGAGKTSLIQASVVPWFRDEGFQICGGFEPRFSALRVNEPPPDDVDVPNRYVFSLVNCLVGQRVGPHAAARTTFEQALTEFAGDRDRRQLVVIDQLEEALTLDRNDRAGQQQLFRQLGAALRRGRRWALLAIREDYLGELDRYRHFFPNELRSTFRLDFLDEDAARRAIQLPALERDVTFTDDAAGQLVSDLRRVRAVSAPLPASIGYDGRRTAGPAAGSAGGEAATPRAPGAPPARDDEDIVYPYVEPVLLQVVCANLWSILSRKSPAGFTRIEASDLDKVRPYNKALSKYYRTAIRAASGRNPDTERAIRDWIERKLLTEQTTRRPTLTLPPVENAREVVKTLQEQYLIRDDPRPGGVFWELSHDKLVQPIVEDNRVWRLSNLKPWQIMAEEWHHSGRDRRLLLTGPDYRAARAEARKIALGPIEEAFLEECRRLADQEAQLARFHYRINNYRLVLRFSLVLNGVFVIALVAVAGHLIGWW